MNGSRSITTKRPRVGYLGYRTWMIGWSMGLLMGLAATAAALAEPASKTAGDKPAATATALNKELAGLAAEIKACMEQRGEHAIAIGEFPASANLAVSAGRAIAKTLGDELTKLHVEISRKAALQVSGEYSDATDEKTDRKVVRILAKIKDRNGSTICELQPRDIFDLTTIVLLTGVTLDLNAADTKAKPADKEEKREETLKKAIDSPNPHVEAQTVVSAGANSPYAVEISVGNDDDYRPRKVEVDRDGLSFVQIHAAEKYAVRLVNNSAIDSAVTLTIDGLNVFAFSETPGYTHWIVPARSSLLVKGWHRTNQVSNKFEVTGFADTAAARELKSSSDLGTITASFAAAWSVDEQPPAGEEEAKGAEEPSQGTTGTGVGGEVKVQYREVRRHVGRLRGAVSVRYNKAIEPRDLPATSTSTTASH